MSIKNRAEMLADALENLEATGWGGDSFALTDNSEEQAKLAAAELRRLSASEAALLEALERAASSLSDDSLYDRQTLEIVCDLIARTKGARNA